MRIDSSDITLASEYRAMTRRSQRESLTVTVGPPPSAVAPAATAPSLAVTGTDETSPTAQGLDPKLLLLKLVVESLSGHKIRVMHAEEMTPGATPAVPQTGVAAQSAATPAAQPSWGVSYQAETRNTDSQHLRVTAQGVVITADQREIPFALELNLAETTMSTQTASFRAGTAAVDPLVIHFSGPAAALTTSRIAFDLDADGRDEQIPFTAQGSGFLVLDRDGNGRVTDGRELFGPATGNGFSELAQLDSDGNGWLDAADAAFGALQVWTQDADGVRHLTPLAAHGVGALYLSNLGAPFHVTDDAGVPLGEARRVSLYLTEDGRADVVQQIDLHV